MRRKPRAGVLDTKWIDEESREGGLGSVHRAFGEYGLH